MAQEGRPPGSQSMSTSRPSEARRRPLEGASVGLQSCGAAHQRPTQAGSDAVRPPRLKPLRRCAAVPELPFAWTRGSAAPPRPWRCRAYLCPRLGSSSLALPQPGLRYRAGSPAPCASAPSSSSSSSSVSSASWMATRICTAVSGPGRASSPGWAMARGPAGLRRRRVPAPRGRASRAAASATEAAEAAGEGRGSRRPAPRRSRHRPAASGEPA